LCLVPCNAAGGILEYMDYVKEGNFVPGPVLDPELGIEYELFAERRASGPGDRLSFSNTSSQPRRHKGQSGDGTIPTLPIGTSHSILARED
jgi:hypothetical protein